MDIAFSATSWFLPSETPPKTDENIPATITAEKATPPAADQQPLQRQEKEASPQLAPNQQQESLGGEVY
jgi:hypothetical protein